MALDTAGRVAAAVVTLSRELTPCPVPDVAAVSARLAEDLSSWSRLVTTRRPTWTPGSSATWIDLVLFALDPAVHGGIDPEALLASTEFGGRPDPDAVTGLLLGLAGMWAEACRKAGPPGMPTLRAHQRRFHDAALAWGRRRSGWA